MPNAKTTPSQLNSTLPKTAAADVSGVRDLSTVHGLMSNMFSLPRIKPEWEQFRLSREQIDFFNEYGYLAGLRLLNTEQVDILRSELSGLMTKSHPANHLFHYHEFNESEDRDTMLFHALGAWRITPGFHDVLWNPAFLVPASQLMGGAIRLWHDQLFCKPAHHGGVVAWHQDYSYWTRTIPMQHLTCWIGLDDSTTENGCLYYVPKAHKWNLLPVTGLTGNMDEIMTVLSPEQNESFHPVPIELKRGERSFHHPLLVHGSYENRSNRPRGATLINVFRDGVQSADEKEPLRGVPPIAPGHKMVGQFFPLLFDPDSQDL
jgi:hypothetical protein